MPEPAGGRQQAHRHRRAGVQPDARKFERRCDRLFQVCGLSQTDFSKLLKNVCNRLD